MWNLKLDGQKESESFSKSINTQSANRHYYFYHCDLIALSGFAKNLRGCNINRLYLLY